MYDLNDRAGNLIFKHARVRFQGWIVVVTHKVREFLKPYKSFKVSFHYLFIIPTKNAITVTEQLIDLLTLTFDFR
ncbi:hypothetical protein WUBG_18020 [Wuchereria bancrofti]|uniref:Uncharacterized protein n=1 Tax=Wuchereria bancrofti TaxID=6293 RepID=J9E6X1_WUCBA|nr:hypothetical protein WUBG_18020 [Wuchereria bancrofti]